MKGLLQNSYFITKALWERIHIFISGLQILRSKALVATCGNLSSLGIWLSIAFCRGSPVGMSQWFISRRNCGGERLMLMSLSFEFILLKICLCGFYPSLFRSFLLYHCTFLVWVFFVWLGVFVYISVVSVIIIIFFFVFFFHVPEGWASSILNH